MLSIKYMLTILDISEKNKVTGEIYIITNTINGKSYVGQTRSHRLNHKKYRPFGYLGRFKDHENECYSNKKNCCKYLNSAILKYGIQNFECKLLITCNLEELDEYEIQYISDLNTKFPNGYNLTDGGKTCRYVSIDKNIKTFDTRSLNLKKSKETKDKISVGIKNALKNVDKRKSMMLLTQKQHENAKLEKFKSVQIDTTDLSKYISIRNCNKQNYQYIKLNINGITTSFVSKYDSIEVVKNRAIDFINKIIKMRDDQNDGNILLEPPILSSCGKPMDG